MEPKRIDLAKLDIKIVDEIENPILKVIIQKNIYRLHDMDASWSEYDKYQEYADAPDHWDN